MDNYARGVSSTKYVVTCHFDDYKQINSSPFLLHCIVIIQSVTLGTAIMKLKNTRVNGAL